MERWRWRRPLAATVALGLLCTCFSIAFSQAPRPAAPRVGPLQFVQRQVIRGVPRNPAPEARGDDELSLDGVFLPPDRTAKRRLEMAEQMLEERRWGEGVRLLGSLLENPEDFFFKPNADQPVYRSLKAEAGRLVASLPGDGRESYELQFGARARQTLEQAAKAGDLAALAEVSRRFFYTQAGQEATFLLARQNLDQNRPLAAALGLERLRELPTARTRLEPVLSLTLATCWLRSGKPDKAKETLVRLKRTHGTGDIVIGGKPVKLFANDSTALAWMQEHAGTPQAAHALEADGWALFRGDESRNAASKGGAPLLNVRWRQRTADDSTVEKFIGKVRRDLLSQEIAALPSLHPLAVGDVVIMRTAFAIEAVDFQNGKLVWKYPSTDDSFEQFLKAGTMQQPGQSAQQLFAGLDQRMWEDATYGTLSSDGERVYYLDDLGLFGVNFNSRMTVLPNGHRNYSTNSRGTNRLAARELRTQGKLKWEVGGVTGEDEPKLAGAFFLGPPLPLLGHLYALAEMKGQEIRLMVLSAKTGALEWSQQLAVVEQSVVADVFRRNSGASPSFADGILICPTSAGAIVAIDLTKRSLQWGYQYPRAVPTERFNIARPASFGGSERRANEHWVDGSVTISAGRVLITPPESDQIYCLNLADGKELWKQSRGNHLYVACVHDGNVILVGRNAVTAVRLSDGEKAWPDLELPSGSMPSGRGFASGTNYFLPLTSAEVARINVTTGRIEQRSRSRGGIIPGNLVAHRGSILSQGVDSLDAYFQVDSLKGEIAKTLQAHPDDPKALAGLGEVKLDEGHLQEAVDLFRRSYHLKDDEATRQELVESLLEALRADFAANRKSLDELDGLIDQPANRLTFLRLKALGLQAAGDMGPAFETYMQLVDENSPTALDTVDERLSVRRDRWIRSQLEQLRAAASGADRERIDAAVTARLKTAVDANSAPALRSFIAVFGSHPAGETARNELLSRLTKDDLLERSILLRDRERSADSALAGSAAADMAQSLRAAGRLELAAIYYRQLAGRFAEVVCRDGKTGKQLVTELPADDPVTKLLTPLPAWPAGKVTAREDKMAPRAGAPPRMLRAPDLDIGGPANPLFSDVTVVYDAQQQNLVAHDGLGAKRFKLSLNEQAGRRFVNRNPYNVPLLTHATATGGLLVLSLGNQLMAIDVLSAGDGAGKGVVWSQDLNEQIAGYSPGQGIGPRLVNLPWGGSRSVWEDAAGRRMSTIGPVTDDGIYFQRLHDLYCIDPQTGKTVWMRKNVGSGNDLFGDDELLFVAPTGDGETQVLRAATGELVGTRKVAPFNKRVTTVGRQVLSWELQHGKHALEMRDPWLDQSLWSFSFEPGSKAAVAGQDAVGVLQPNGEFTLVSLADGKPLVKEQLEPETSLLNIYLLRSSDGYLLVTNCVARNEPNVSVQAVPNIANSPLINGRVYAFDLSGKKRWPAPVVLAQQSLMLSQPKELPLLVLARQAHRQGPLNNREPKISVLCIDKRTGRIAYQNEQIPGSAMANLEIVADATAKSLTINVATRTLSLALTDEPLEAEGTATETPPSK